MAEKKQVAECLRHRRPTKEEANAFKALHRGEATARQQALSLKYLVDVLCRTHDLLYIPDNPEQTAFINGRAYVGSQILKLLNVPIGKLKLIEEKEETTNE